MTRFMVRLSCPVGRVPEETFCRILDHLGLDDRVSVSQVSRVWRTVSYRCTVPIVIERQRTQDSASVILLSRQLEPFQNARLRFERVGVSSSSLASPRFVLDVREMLERWMCQVEHLTLDVTRPLGSSILTVLEGATPKLRSLRVCGSHELDVRHWTMTAGRVTRVALCVPFPATVTFPAAVEVELSGDAVRAPVLSVLPVVFPCVQDLAVFVERNDVIRSVSLPASVRRLCSDDPRLLAAVDLRGVVSVCLYRADMESNASTLGQYVAALDMRAVLHADIVVDVDSSDGVSKQNVPTRRVTLRTLHLDRRERVCVVLASEVRFALWGVASLLIRGMHLLALQPLLDMTSVAHLEVIIDPGKAYWEVFSGPVMHCPALQRLTLTVAWTAAKRPPYTLCIFAVGNFVSRLRGRGRATLHILIRGASVPGGSSFWHEDWSVEVRPVPVSAPYWMQFGVPRPCS